MKLAILAVVILCWLASATWAQTVRAHERWAIYQQASEADWRAAAQGENPPYGGRVEVRPTPNHGLSAGPEAGRLLTDGARVATGMLKMWQDKAGVGWAYQAHVRIVVDLGEAKPVGRVVMRLQTSASNEDTTPRSINSPYGEHGRYFSPVRSLSQKVHAEDNPALTFEPLPPSEAAIHAFALDAGYQARYVRLDMAVNKGRPLVCDEIAVLAATGPVQPLPPPPAREPDFHDNVFDRRDQFQKLIAPGNLVAGKKLHYAPKPNYRLTTDENDPLDLTDGKLGERSDERIWFEKAAVCWQHSPLITIFADLEQPQPIAEVVMRLLGGGEQGSLRFPDPPYGGLSNDGKDYYLA